MRSLLMTAVLLVVVAGSAPAHADDGPLNPPLREMTTHEDPGGIVSIQLPRTWSAQGKGDIDQSLERWAGWIQPTVTDAPDLRIECEIESGYRNAWLLRYFHGVADPRFGKRLDEFHRTGEGWIQDRWHNEANDTVFVTRLVVSDQGVFELIAYAHQKMFPHVHRHIDALFDTFAVVGKRPEKPWPDGYRASVVDGVQVWTNAPAKKAKLVKNAALTFLRGWEIGRTVLAGAPAAKLPARVVFCADAESYEKLVRDSVRGPIPGYGIPELDRWTIVMTLADAKKKTIYKSVLQRYGGLAYARRFVGGPAPAWVEWGIAQRALIEADRRGKFTKPSTGDIKNAKKAIAAMTTPFAELVKKTTYELTANPDLLYELWAWHYYLGEVAANDLAGSAFAAYLELLRTKGDPDAALKAFDNVDPDDMTTGFHAWARDWK